MPKLKYKEYNPKSPEIIEAIDNANVILQEYAAQGINLTLRGLYYQFVSRHLFPDAWADENGILNRMENYTRLKVLVARARDAGMIDWNHIVDRGRKVSEYPHYDDPEDFITRTMPNYFLDMWEDQPKRVQVWVEKDALAQVIEMAADPFDVPTFATKGYSSASALWDLGYNRFRRYAQAGQEIVIIHLSDHDPSGINMTEDILSRMCQYVRRTEAAQITAHLEVQRLALTMAQVQEFTDEGNPLPADPAKQTDSRFRKYSEEYDTESSWELDAVEPTRLAALITNAIEEHLDRDLYDARRALERDHRAQLSEVSDRWDDITNYLENN